MRSFFTSLRFFMHKVYMFSCNSDAIRQRFRFLRPPIHLYFLTQFVWGYQTGGNNVTNIRQSPRHLSIFRGGNALFLNLYEKKRFFCCRFRNISYLCTAINEKWQSFYFHKNKLIPKRRSVVRQSAFFYSGAGFRLRGAFHPESGLIIKVCSNN